MIARLQTFLFPPSRLCSTSHNYFSTLFAVSLTLAAISQPAFAADPTCTEGCSTPTGNWAAERPRNCLQDPGWFDIGAGVVVIKNAGISQQNGVGNMVSLRAYPFGRWYAPLKPQPPTDASQTETAVKFHLAKEASEKAKNSRDKAKAIAPALDKAAAEKTADTDQVAADKANEDLARNMQTALNAFGDNYALEELDGWKHWGSRVSFFLGRSVGGFDSKVVEGDINAFGISFDIAPEFSVVWGRAYFDLPAQTGVANSSSAGTVFGVQINLNAFKAMRGLTGSL